MHNPLMRTSIEIAWDTLYDLLDEHVPNAVARRINDVVNQIVLLETQTSNKQASEATELMIKDVALREQIMLNAIVNGAYDHLKQEARVTCNTCQDSHQMNSSSGYKVMCTRCPIPCQGCRANGNGAYCSTTPCSCKCHLTRDPEKD